LLAPGIAVTAARPASPGRGEHDEVHHQAGQRALLWSALCGYTVGSGGVDLQPKVPGRVAEMVAQALAEA
jgi:hypothetical protein